MFLKRLDVLGFKSFAERVTIDFVPGVTAVVGPNGSGKSNITDAIRWVLGEQSAKSLRGGKMEDVIFAGSDSRKPLNIAEVTLTLDNEDQALPLDYAEVSVTRRVYRSGDSEYLLNNQSCRLKDIVDLFMDSGLGKDAFSIIGQGRVEQILNSKPEDRRIILEEAAGVLKYKNRRKKADMKLVETQENLYRVQDILHELEGQIEPLKIQSSIAKDYLEKKADLERTEVSLLVHDIEQMNKEWEQAKASHQTIEKQEEEKQHAITVIEAGLIEKRDHIEGLDESVNDLQKVLLTVTEETEQLEGRRQVLVERRKNAHQNEEQMRQAMNELEMQIGASQEALQLNEKMAEESKRRVNSLADELNAQKHELKQLEENIEEQLEQIKNDYFDALNEKTSINNELSYTDQQIDQQSKRADKLIGQNSKYIEERKQRLAQKEKKQQELNDLSANLDQTTKDYVSLQGQIKQSRETIEKLEAQLYKAYQFVSQAKSRKEMLETMEDDFSGFYQGVKEVLKARNKHLKGIEGAVAELLTVDKRYELAVETALGGSTQSIVTQNEQDARSAIQFLKKNRYGRATFLPMSVIKPKSLQQHQYNAASEHPSFINVASSIVTFDEQHRTIIENLLGNVLIVKDLKGANELAARLQYRFRLVTIEGDIVNPGGSMTGGAQSKNNASLLSRKNELEQLKIQIPEIERTTTLLESKVKEAKDQSSASDQEIEALRSEGEALRIRESEMKSVLREIEAALKQTDDRLALYDLEMGEFTYSKTELEQRKTGLYKRLEELEKLLSDLNDQMSELTKKRQSQRSSKEELTAKFSTTQSSLAVAKEQKQQLKREGDQLLLELEKATKRKQALSEDLEWMSKELHSGEDHEELLQKSIEEKQQDRQQTTTLISKRREERLTLQQEVEQLERELKEFKRLQKGLQQGLHDEIIRINRLEVELDSRIRRLEEEYQLTFNGAKLQYPLVEPVDDARRKVKLIKLSIDELGSVNIGAIEEYDRVAERHEFLLEQQMDLLEAKDTLQKVIAEMDDEMTRRFSETFDQVKIHFTHVFKELFGGGRAELKLTDPSDHLHAGVEIVAQPPGKKLQNLGLMSGGERALTAIALLFAILKVRPVPFCVLDEVEAALDEANVHRFSQYLRAFSQQSQFIVITHRKGTMEGADVLYGVTMQESGVSKLVSVRLEEDSVQEPL
ncbi:chromosome segregation protein SMC [Jeotgalibacillus soli]|uniref:Chromosome partition protein Smc n=1 Tax=Jeotgalibacillus soli TaxID=889306 RepID=A0A0C2VK52_9BACL|nr:chromosome segregation protein SMC [Jeotgalibacillus soli]KIL44856.1 chromosome partitioning protein Smc [Jeotgalibacillus soli]